MKMVGIVGFHINDTNTIVFRVLRIRGNGVVGIDANEIDLLESEIIGQLQTRKGDGTASVGDLIGLGRKVESVGITLAGAVIEENRIIRFPETITEIDRKQFL